MAREPGLVCVLHCFGLKVAIFIFVPVFVNFWSAADAGANRHAKQAGRVSSGLTNVALLRREDDFGIERSMATDGDVDAQGSLGPRHAELEQKPKEPKVNAMQKQAGTNLLRNPAEESQIWQIFHTAAASLDIDRWLPPCVHNAFKAQEQHLSLLPRPELPNQSDTEAFSEGGASHPFVFRSPVYVVHGDLDVQIMEHAPWLNEPGVPHKIFWVDGFQEDTLADLKTGLSKCFFGDDLANEASMKNSAFLRRTMSKTLKHWFIYWHMLTRHATEAVILEDNVQPMSGWIRKVARMQRFDIASLREAKQVENQTELVGIVRKAQAVPYDLVSLSDCHAPVNRSLSEWRSRHLISPPSNFSQECYSGYTISAVGALKLLVARLGKGGPGLQIGKLPAVSEGEDQLGTSFVSVAPHALMAQVAWALGPIDFRFFWYEPAFVRHGEPSFTDVPSMPTSESGLPPNGDSLGVLGVARRVLALYEKKAKHFVIHIGAGSGLGTSLVPNRIYELFSKLELPGIVVEADNNMSKLLEANLPWNRVQKLPGVTASPLNVERILRDARTPTEPLYFRLDIDSYDCDVLHAVLAAGFKPWVIHMNVNSEVPLPYMFGVHFMEDFQSNDGAGGFYGCSLALIDGLLRPLGYYLVGAGGNSEVMYVRQGGKKREELDNSVAKARNVDFTEIPLKDGFTALQAAMQGISRFDDTVARKSWQQVQWAVASADLMAEAKDALTEACALTQGSGIGFGADNTSSLQHGCPVPFTFSMNFQDYVIRAYATVARAARITGNLAAKAPAWADQGLWNGLAAAAKPDEVTEGSIISDPKQMTAYADLVTKPSHNHVCEVGFNAGHSALVFLLWLRPGGTLTSFDDGAFNYSKRCADYLQQAFPDSFSIVWGNSTKTLAQENTRPPCDLAVVDGGHLAPVPLLDLQNLRRLSRFNATVVMDDTSCSEFWCKDPSDAWQQSIKDGTVEAIDDYITLNGRGGSHGFSTGRFLADAPSIQASPTPTPRIWLAVGALGILCILAFVAVAWPTVAPYLSSVKLAGGAWVS